MLQRAFLAVSENRMALKTFSRDSMSRRVRAGALVFVLVAIGAYVWRGEQGRSVPTALPAASRTATIYTGRVVDVSDGDSVRFATASGVRKIRLDSIDAPERSAGRDRPGQPHAEASRRHLEQWLAGRRVTAYCHAIDQYGRDVCIVQDAQGATANRAQVEGGHAWAYTAAKGRYLRDVTFPHLQSEARAARRGLWVDPDPVAPWTWRYDCWRQRRCGDLR